MRLASPTLISTKIFNLRGDQELDFVLAQLPPVPSLMDSVTHVVCSLCICGVRGNDRSAVSIMRLAKGGGKLINGGSNICVMGILTILLNVENILPIDISLALDGTSSSLDDKITKRGLLPLTLADGTIYYQKCFCCTNMVGTIISPAAILASSNVFYF